MAASGPEHSPGPKVLWVSHGYGYGGDLMYFGEIFRSFRDLVPRMAVVVDKTTDYDNRYDIELLPLMRMHRRPIRRTTAEGQVYDTEVAMSDPRLVSELAKCDADVFIVIEFTPPALMATLAASMSKSKKLVLLVESDPAARGGSRNPLVRAVKRWAVKRADVIQTNNDKGRRYLIEDLKADPAKVTVAPYLTSRPPGPPCAIERSGALLKLLFVNSINQRKGVKQLLDALESLDPRVREQIDMTIVGDGPERAQLEARSASLGMGERLRFLGRCPYGDLGPHYADADVLVHPSLADYRSLSGFEGLSYGLAILASKHDGATAETVEEGVNGFVIDPHDTKGFAATITRMVEDRDLVHEMRQASRDLYTRRYSLEAVARNLADSVQSAMRR